MNTTGAVLVSPHIDDAAFSLGAALSSGCLKARAVSNVFSVSNCTANGRDRDVTRITALRKNEDARFFNALAQRIERIYLDRLDAPLRLAIAEEDVCRVTPDAGDTFEAEQLRGVLEEQLHTATLLFAPLGLGAHVDHVLAHSVACDLARAEHPVAFYEDLPYAGGMGLIDIERAVEQASHRVGRALAPHLLAMPREGCFKTDLLAAYESQIDSHTVTRIVRHSARLADGVFAERVWV